MSDEKSALLHKFRTALRAADHDAPLSAGDPDLLPAVRAIVDVILDALAGAAARMAEKGADPAAQGQKLLVFGIAAGNVAGKRPEIDQKKKNRVGDACETDKGQRPGKREKSVQDPLRGEQNDHKDGHKTGKLVRAVSSLHEQRESIAEISEHNSLAPL